MNRFMAQLFIIASLVLAYAPTGAFANSESSESAIVAVRPYTAKFLDEMTSHHRQGVMMARLVESRALHAELKTMARMMIMDQEREIQEMQSIRERSFPRLWKPADRGAGMNLPKLSSLRGLAFDLAFIDSMISHHPAAIYLGQEARRKSGNAAVRQLGSKIASKQAQELDQLRAWRDSWSGR